MADADRIIAGMERAMCPGFSAEEIGRDTYLVHTGYTFQDGDELHIVLRRGEDGWMLTDNGHTTMWLSYEDFAVTESRRAVLMRTLSYNYARYDEGRIWMPLGEEDAGGVIKSMVQAILGAADLLYLNRQNVRSTFSDDVKAYFREMLGSRCEFDKKIRSADGNETYAVDIYVEGETPLMVFEITSQDRCKDATYAMYVMKNESHVSFNTLAIMDEAVYDTLRKEDVKRINNRSDKMFIGFPKDEMPAYLRKNGLLTTCSRGL